MRLDDPDRLNELLKNFDPTFTDWSVFREEGDLSTIEEAVSDFVDEISVFSLIDFSMSS